MSELASASNLYSLEERDRTRYILSILHNLDGLITDAMANGNNAAARRYADAAHTIMSDYSDQYDRNRRPTVYNSPHEHLNAYQTAQEVIARYPLFKDALERAAGDELSKARAAFFATYTHDPDEKPVPEPKSE